MKGMGSHQSARADSEVWLTPPEIIHDLGPFDLDPCAAPAPRPWPTAERHVSLPGNGLAVPWSGFVWCNPPYGRETEKWLARMDNHAHGLALIFARTETEMFFTHIWRGRSVTGILFIEGRLYFHRKCGTRAAANSGAPSVLVAYGAEAFQRLQRSTIAGALVDRASIVVADRLARQQRFSL